MHIIIHVYHCRKIKEISTETTWSDFKITIWTSNSNIHRTLLRKLPTWQIGLTYKHCFLYLPKERTFIYHQRKIMSGTSTKSLPRDRLVIRRNNISSETGISCPNLYRPIWLPIEKIQLCSSLILLKLSPTCDKSTDGG